MADAGFVRQGMDKNKGSEPGSRDPSLKKWHLSLVSLTATGAAGFFSLQVRRDMKSGPHGGIYKIEFDGFDAFEEIFIDHEGNTFVRKKGVIIPWLIQSQTQSGPRSATLAVYDPDRRDGVLFL
jgi:hypothetical protein